MSAAFAMSASERATITACAEALLPPGGAIAVSGLEAGVVPYFERMIGRVPATTRMLLRALIRFIEFSPWMFGPFKTRMTRLPIPDRVKVIQSLAESRIYLLRTSFVAIRACLTLAYFGHASVNRAMGLPWQESA